MDSPALLFVLSVLTTYWLWWVLARATLLDRWREALYNRWPPSAVRASTIGRWNAHLRECVQSSRASAVGKARKVPDVSMWAKGLDCPWCAGFWLSGAVTGLLAVVVGVPWPSLWWLASAAAVGIVGSR